MAKKAMTYHETEYKGAKTGRFELRAELPVEHDAASMANYRLQSQVAYRYNAMRTRLRMAIETLQREEAQLDRNLQGFTWRNHAGEDEQVNAVDRPEFLMYCVNSLGLLQGSGPELDRLIGETCLAVECWKTFHEEINR